LVAVELEFVGSPLKELKATTVSITVCKNILSPKQEGEKNQNIVVYHDDEEDRRD
jgi:hypothetical protein